MLTNLLTCQALDPKMMPLPSIKFCRMSSSSYEINPYEETRLYTSNAERERWESMATLFSIIVSLDALERAYMRESVSEAQYAPACTRLLGQFKTISKLVMSGDEEVATPSSSSTGGVPKMAGVPVIRDLKDFMKQFKMSHAAAAHRLQVGVPATVEHASAATSSSSERAKWVAETTQGFITFMDALKLKLRAKDQLHPLLSDLMSSYSRFGDQDSEGRARVLHWLITLNQMKASDEIDEDQARQMLFDLENAYSAWFRSLQNS